jgi:hypothetical protein
METPETPQNAPGVFGRPVLARLGPLKPPETHRAGVEVKRVPSLAFWSGDERRRGRRGGRLHRCRSNTTPLPALEDHASADPPSNTVPLQDLPLTDAAAPSVRRRRSYRRPSSPLKLESFVSTIHPNSFSCTSRCSSFLDF